MSEAVTPRLRPICDRALLLERQQELAATAARIDAEQQQLAVEFARVRAELVAIRAQLWPAEPGHAFAETRRPRVAGPAPVPPPVAAASPVWGRALRDTALRVVLRAGAPCTLTEIHRAPHLAGFVIDAGDPVKRLGDALGYEGAPQHRASHRAGHLRHRDVEPLPDAGAAPARQLEPGRARAWPRCRP